LKCCLDDLIGFAGVGGWCCGKACNAENEEKKQGLHSSHMGCIRNEMLEKRKSEFAAKSGPEKELQHTDRGSLAIGSGNHNVVFSVHRDQKLTSTSVTTGLMHAEVSFCQIIRRRVLCMESV
jgi:hypothetical protein